jgi:hypothetical protein
VSALSGGRGTAGAPGPEGSKADPPERMPAWQWAVRLVWLAFQIILVLWFGQKGVQFVYQGF